ncbi:MAG: DUF373 family protein, partial [archaeon]|nr:DUF373 family protein [archaeon]
MKNTLILVVDRDDDFGFKANVESPVVGVKACTDAAVALGVADPEDSDTNALFAAINLYREMEKDPKAGRFEIALICGNQKVGYLSDRRAAEQLDTVLDRIKPDHVVLVGDGAEDEYIYPIVSSRAKIDSVRKVYVKQAPSVEGTFYILTRMLNDPQKRERFLAPISWLLMLVSMVYIIVSAFTSQGVRDFLDHTTTTILVFIVGFILYAYSNDVSSKWHENVEKWKNRWKVGSLSLVFDIAAMMVILFGVVVGVYSVRELYLVTYFEVFAVFLANLLWFGIFSVMLVLMGWLLDNYFNNHTIKYSFITTCLNLLATGLVITGAVDFIVNYIGLRTVPPMTYILEILAGFGLAFIAAALHHYIKNLFLPVEPVPEPDAQP